MTVRDIAEALSPGNAHRSGQCWRCVCPVHGSRTGRSLSLALRDHPRGLAVYCHAGCSRDEIIAELRRRGLIAAGSGGVPSWPATARSVNANAVGRIELARRIWDEARDVCGTPVARYLVSRGFTLPLSPSLSWLPRCRHPSGVYLPAMIGRVDNVDGELIAVHRTYLERDGSGVWRRRDRAMLGPVAGGAVRLAPAAEMLLIGEGIETCLAAMQATAQPTWAALSTSGVTALMLPPLVRTVIILADHDLNGVGERAARRAAQRWLAEGRRVRITMPPKPGTDFNDVLWVAHDAAA